MTTAKPTSHRWNFWLLPLALLLGGGVVVLVLYGLGFRPPPRCLDLAPAPPSTAVFELVNPDLDVAIAKQKLLNAPDRVAERAQAWAMFGPKGGWQGLISFVEVQPQGVPSPWTRPAVITSALRQHLFYLVGSGFTATYPLRIVFLVDNAQATIKVPGTEAPADFYDVPALESYGEHALEFALPPLEPGFHQLSMLFITDPATTTTDYYERSFQRGALAEGRLDMWVDTVPFAPEVPGFDNLMVGISATARIYRMAVVEPPRRGWGQPPGVKWVTSLTLQAQQTTCLHLDLFYHWQEEWHGAYTGTVPLRLGVFWNDKMTQVLDYPLGKHEGDDLILPLNVQAPAEPGLYQLSLVVFPFPGYRLNADFGKETLPASAKFSQRIVVNVQP